MRLSVSVWTVLLLLLIAPGYALYYPTHVIDTHVHNANLSLLNYTFPASFPDLARDWTIADFTNTTADAVSA